MPAVMITGGTGLIGKNLTRLLTQRGYEVIILSRKQFKTSEHPLISYAIWDVNEQKIDTNAIKKADHIINLAGAGVMDKRWSEKYKKEIIESRTKSNICCTLEQKNISNKSLHFLWRLFHYL